MSSKLLNKEDVNKALEKSLSDIFENDRFKDMLNVMAHANNYSLNNTILIVAQKPNATQVMGFNDWRKMGRSVSKGEKAIKILAPYMKETEMEKIDPATSKPVLKEGKPVIEKVKFPVGYFQVNVFDVAQTQGKEISNVNDFIKYNMKNDEYIEKVYGDYKKFLTETKGLEINEKETEKGVGGSYNRVTNEIIVSVNENRNNTEKFHVLIHEYAHSLLHHKDSEMKNLPRGHREAQAESTAYVVSQYYGLDTSDTSIGYIAHWAKDMKVAKKALEEIQVVSSTMIDEIDRMQKENIKSFYADQSKSYEEAKKHLVDYHQLSEEVFNPKNKQETRLELINKENGYILSGVIEYNQKEENHFIRTNRNLIEPLSEISKEGNLAVLNIEKELDQLKEFSLHSRIPEHYEVVEVKGAYIIQSSNGQDVISKSFSNKDEADEFYKRSSMAQALHKNTMIEKDKHHDQLKDNIQTVRQDIREQVNTSVSEYINTYDKKKMFRPTGTHGVTIGWTLLKNPHLKTVGDLEKFEKENKLNPSYRDLGEALDASVNENPKKEKMKVLVVEEEYEKTQ